MKQIYLKKKPKSVVDLLHRVIFVHEKTFEDPEGKKVQTPQGRDRSVRDIKKILKTYYKPRTVARGIKMLKKIEKSNQAVRFWCSDIEKDIISPNSIIPIEIKTLKELLNE